MANAVYGAADHFFLECRLVPCKQINKIGVIKAVRELTNLGLKEAKELCDFAPKPVTIGTTPEEADRIADILIGAFDEVG